MNFLADTYHLFVRHVQTTLRMPVFVFITLFQPFLWLLLFSQLFEKITAVPGFGGDSYLQFLTPGIVVMTALFGSAWSGMGILADLDEGNMDRMLTTPVSRLAIICARVLHACLNVVVQSGIILVLALLLGASIPGGFFGAALILLAAALLGAAFGAVSNGLALLTRKQETLISVINFFTLPLFFLSATLISQELMPDWMGTLAGFNPVNWAVVLARSGMEGATGAPIFGHLLLLAGFTVACSVLATRAFVAYRRML